jgi:glutathione synthase/RimK-type ligase-like ATP-grasp enzyme
MKERRKKVFVIRRVSNLAKIIDEFSSSIEIVKGSFHKLEFCFKDDQFTVLHGADNLEDFSYAWISSFWNSREVAYALKLFFQKNNIEHTEVEESTSKLTDAVKFALNNIRIPDSYFSNSINPIKNIEKIESICEYPLIIKDIKGYKGLNSELVYNREQFIQKLSELPQDKKYIFQKFIPNDYDWGIIVGNGKILSAEKSYRQNDGFLNNAYGGSLEIFVDLESVPEEVKIMAVNAAKSLNLSWCRADIIIDKNTQIPYLLEVNRAPGITKNSTEVDAIRQFLIESVNV